MPEGTLVGGTIPGPTLEVQIAATYVTASTTNDGSESGEGGEVIGVDRGIRPVRGGAGTREHRIPGRTWIDRYPCARTRWPIADGPGDPAQDDRDHPVKEQDRGRR